MKNATIAQNENEDYSYELKIPKERVAVLIGKSGEIKNEIEAETNTKLDIDSEEGEVRITSKDSFAVFNTKMIIQAIGRGVNPDIAMRLLKMDYALEIINIADFTKTKKSQIRLKGRIIGQGGRSRSNLEQLTDVHICVYGKTITLIGKMEDIPVAKKAIEKLLQGSPHSGVYKWLEKQRTKSIVEDQMI